MVVGALMLLALGANPLRKDVFVEADFLQAATHSHSPRKDAIERVRAEARAETREKRIRSFIEMLEKGETIH